MSFELTNNSDKNIALRAECINSRIVIKAFNYQDKIWEEIFSSNIDDKYLGAKIRNIYSYDLFDTQFDNFGSDWITLNIKVLYEFW